MSPGSRFGPLQKYYYIYLPEINPLTFIAAVRECHTWAEIQSADSTESSHTQFYSECDRIPTHKHTVHFSTLLAPLERTGSRDEVGEEKTLPRAPDSSLVWNRTMKKREIIKPVSLSFIQYLQMWKSMEKRTICGRTNNTESTKKCVHVCAICSYGEGPV